ncbi:hypothetical protein HDV05_006543 [Chytridiales sp. JEL 0842]|nr:hypothetical protein HDV05_006543 [Chytridiales sp. JEL 0842]
MIKKEEKDLVSKMLRAGAQGMRKPKYGLACSSGLTLVEVGYKTGDIRWMHDDSHLFGGVDDQLHDAQNHLLDFYEDQRRLAASNYLWSTLVADNLNVQRARIGEGGSAPGLSQDHFRDIIASDRLICQTGLLSSIKRDGAYVPIMKRI